MTPMMIRPILPRFYEIDLTNKVGFIVSTVLMTLSVVLIALLVGRFAAGKFDGNKKKTALCFIGVTALTTLALICFFGCAATTVKGIVLSLILVFSSYEDIKKRECDDYLHLMIVIAAFIGTDLSSIPNMLLSGLFAGGLMLLTMLITKSNIGGADIKIAAACSFLLGLSRGVIGLLAGMILAVVVNVFKKDKKKGFPMIPYLAAGYMAAYFIQV
ncbi:MAG: prepilin peptidase [Clostridia bacterium]|nr:prepilin peptidase [Clostridia bacterium]